MVRRGARNTLLRPLAPHRVFAAGTLPTEEVEANRGLTRAELHKHLQRVNKKRHKYVHVNKKAMDQFRSFTSQRESLLQRKQQLDEGHEAIQELIQVRWCSAVVLCAAQWCCVQSACSVHAERCLVGDTALLHAVLRQTLDAKKDEAIMRTFKQVSQNFTHVFKELVPEGKGSLVMVRDTLAAGGSPPRADQVTSFRGVSIKVRAACVPACCRRAVLGLRARGAGCGVSPW